MAGLCQEPEGGPRLGAGGRAKVEGRQSPTRRAGARGQTRAGAWEGPKALAGQRLQQEPEAGLIPEAGGPGLEAGGRSRQWTEVQAGAGSRRAGREGRARGCEG